MRNTMMIHCGCGRMARQTEERKKGCGEKKKRVPREKKRLCTTLFNRIAVFLLLVLSVLRFCAFADKLHYFLK